MREAARLRAAVRATAVVSLLALGAAGQAPPDTNRLEFSHAARAILCDCGCPPQSVFDCTCGRAEEMRGEVGKMIRSGMSGDEVIAAYVARYGEKIRVVPVASGFNLLAWIGPGVGLLGAGAVLLAVLFRWRRGGANEEEERAPEVPAADDPYLRALERRVGEDA